MRGFILHAHRSFSTVRNIRGTRVARLVLRASKAKRFRWLFPIAGSQAGKPCGRDRSALQTLSGFS